jgi:hypothetical protein
LAVDEHLSVEQIKDERASAAIAGAMCCIEKPQFGNAKPRKEIIFPKRAR